MNDPNDISLHLISNKPTQLRYKIFCIGILLFTVPTLYGKGKLQDSLINALSSHNTSADSAATLFRLAKVNHKIKPNEALKYIEILNELKLTDEGQIFERLLLEAEIWKKKKEFHKSSALYKICINTNKNEEHRGQCHFRIADNYFKQGALDLAIDHFIRAIEIFGKYTKESRKAAAYNKLGRCLDEAGYYTKAQHAYENALEIEYMLENTRGIMQYEKNLADVFKKNGDDSKSLIHFKKAYLIAIERDEKYMIHALHLDFAELHLEKIQLDSAMYYATQAYDFFDILKKNYPSMINSRIILGDIYDKFNNNKKAEENYQSALNLAMARKRVFQVIQARRKLAIIYEKSGKITSAIENLKIATTLNDSIIRSESQLQIARLNEAYESEIKDGKIETLTSKNKIQKLELSRSKWQTLFALFGAVCLGMIAYLFYRSLVLKRKSEAILSEKNAIISSALSEKELLLKEIHHRVKNNLQIVSSLLGLQSEYIKDDVALTAINEGRNRVRSMALIHQNLYGDENLTGINIKKYLEKLIDGLFNSYNLKNSKIKLVQDIEDISLDVDTVVPLGLIANELISNALKHAFINAEKGKVNVSFYQMDNHLVFQVEDDGVGMDTSSINDEMGSFGFQMIYAFKDKMDAALEVTSDQGTCVKLTMNEYIKTS